jgi:hypothetical protein
MKMNRLTAQQNAMIAEVQAEMSADELAKYVSEFTAETSAPEHDKYIVSAALLGNRTAMLLCHMS